MCGRLKIPEILEILGVRVRVRGAGCGVAGWGVGGVSGDRHSGLRVSSLVVNPEGKPPEGSREPWRAVPDLPGTGERVATSARSRVGVRGCWPQWLSSPCEDIVAAAAAVTAAAAAAVAAPTASDALG